MSCLALTHNDIRATHKLPSFKFNLASFPGNLLLLCLHGEPGKMVTFSLQLWLWFALHVHVVGIVLSETACLSCLVHGLSPLVFTNTCVY